MMDDAGSPRSPASTRLAEILAASLEALAAAGQVDEACRLAGQACAAARGSDPQVWRRLNVLLHRLTKNLSWRTLQDG